MIRDIYVKSYPNFFFDSILITIPFLKKFETGVRYRFLEYGSNQFLFYKFLVDQRIVKLKNITDETAYLSKGCDKKTFIEIQTKCYKKTIEDEILILTFNSSAKNYDSFEIN